MKYLEQQLQIRRMLGRAVMLTGIAAGLTSLTACGQSKLPKGCENDSTETELAGDVAVEGYMEPEPEEEQEEIVRGKIPAPVDTIRPINNDEKVMTGVVEFQPQFPGGLEACKQFIKENLRYPDTELDVQGRVIVSFMVERDGSLSDIKVVKGLDPAYDEEALRVVKMMPKWSPGATDGQISVMRYTLPVIFKKE